MKDLIIKTFKDNLLRNTSGGRDDQGHAVHASGIYSMCVRRHMIAKLHPDIRMENTRPTIAQAVTWRIGNKLQEIVTENMHGLLFGLHRNARGEIIFGVVKDRSAVYYETQLEFSLGKHFKFTSSMDMFITDYNKKVRAAEIKSLKPDSFDTITDDTLPLSYRYQVNSYLWNLKHVGKASNTPDMPKGYEFAADKGYLIYICKTQKPMPIKVFEIKPDAIIQKDIDQKFKELKTFSLSGKLPKRICSTKHHMMARECAVMNHCFTL